MEIKKKYQNRCVLITGAAGYIGSKIILKLRDQDCHIKACVYNDDEVKNLTKVVGKAPKCSIEFFQGDIRDPKCWEQWITQGIDAIFLLAAQTSHYVANENPPANWEINVQPIVFLANACKKNNVLPRIVFASSATVYGILNKLPADESFLCNPVSIYDIHKLTAEHYLKYYHQSFELDTVSLRLSNVYGPSYTSSQRDRGVLNLMAGKALRGEEITVFGKGDWLRDYIHLDDVVEAFLYAGIGPAQNLRGKSFNICSGVGTRYVDVIQLLVVEANNLVGWKSPIVHTDGKNLTPVDERNYIGIHQAFTDATQWNSSIDLRDGIRNLLQVLAHEK
jgi:UDP-glucose 4-epimerase